MLGLLALLQAAAPVLGAATVDPIVRDGVRAGAYPGAVVAIGTADSVLYLKGYGRLTWSAASAPADPETTVYDLASVTKVVATTTAVMLLVDRGRVALDAPVVRYLPEFAGAGTAVITVRELLAHTSGLRGDLPIAAIRGAPDAASLLRLVYAETPRFLPGTRVLYSDLNAVLLGEIVRRASGEDLDAFVAREVFAPLGMTETRYRPPRNLMTRIAPTGLWRGHPVAGVVNDPTAWKLGGISGNAGVFSTARDVARFAQFVLRGGVTADGRRLVRAETVRAFTTRAAYFGLRTEARALGWQAVPTGEQVSSAGSRFGPRSIGHTGWTGTSLWIDPDRGVFVALLTNRAFAPRSREPFTVLKRVRGRLADLAAEAMDARAH
ncbi:MAG TPA: serine hydrolase domain-containing protein [Gemmatimonadales bacterium]|nr:serine hydrolase domain-containing protein [Gemmatimonadales bacterium]